MMPTIWEGNRRSTGKPNPVTLVATVVTRNRVFQRSGSFPASRPNMTINPAPIPIELSSTCT
jgi:hypothetical protein